MGFIKLTTFDNTVIWVQVRYIIELEQLTRGTYVYMRGLKNDMLHVMETANDIIAMIGGMEE